MANAAKTRFVQKTSDISYVEPSVPNTNNHTDGTWIDTDIYKGEIFINTADEKIYTRVESGILGLTIKPYGGNGEIQFNNGNTFLSSPYLKYDPSNNSSVVGALGGSNDSTSSYSNIIGGIYNINTNSSGSIIVTGNNNYNTNSYGSFVSGSNSNSNIDSYGGFIGGGANNTNSENSEGAIIGGVYNYITSCINGVTVGSQQGSITLAQNSILIGGYYNTITGTGLLGETTNVINTVVIGGSYIAGNRSSSVYVPNIILSNADNSNPVTGLIIFDGTHFQGYDGSTWKQLDN